MQNAKRAESMSGHAFSQFELTSNIITKLNTFKLTPTAKLVLLYLTTCYNPKHKEVFPKQKTIADKLGVSERSVTRAIQELFNEGLILIECKYTNRYKFTSKIVQEPPLLPPENLSDNLGQNGTIQDDNLSPHVIEQTRVTKKEQRGKFLSENIPPKYSIENRGGNVYENEILADYAIKHGAKNMNAYIAKLKQTGSANKIICEYKMKKNYTQITLRNIEETQNQIKLYEGFKQDAVKPSIAWVEFGKKLGIKR